MRIGRLGAEWLAAGLAVACYCNILLNDFCYDDVPVVRDNEKVNAPSQWKAIWTTDYWSQTKLESPHRDLLYRPVTLSLFRLTRTVAGATALTHHLLSIGLHVICTVLMVRLARRLAWDETTVTISGLLFAVLPIHSEVVAAVVGQADLLATIGVASAMLLHAQIRTGRSRGIQAAWSAAAGIAAFLAMGAKESGVAVLPLMILWDAYLTRDHAGSSSGRWWSARTGRRLAYLLFPLAAYAALRWNALGGQLHQAPAPSKTVNVLVDAPPWQHALGVVQAWGMYWSKTFFPGVLCIEYSINAVRLAASLIHLQVLIGIFATLALFALVARAWPRRNFAIIFLVAALLVCYAPTSNAVVLMQVFFAERVWYLPSVFAVLLLAGAIGPILRNRPLQAAGLALVLAMLARCWVRNAEWSGNGALFAAAYRDHPESVLARRLYGQWLVQNGDFERGEKLIQSALAIDLGFTDAHRSLGHAYLSHGRFEEAVHHLQIAEMQVSGHPRTQAALRKAVENLEARHADKLNALEANAEAEPENIEVQLTLVRALRDAGRTEQALNRLRDGNVKFGDRPGWAAETAVTLVYLDRLDEAIAGYRRALELAPDGESWMVELAMLLIERRGPGDFDEAWKLADHAVAVSPDDPNALACRAELLALRGDIRGAVESYRKAIGLLPGGHPQRRIFEERVKALGK